MAQYDEIVKHLMDRFANKFAVLAFDTPLDHLTELHLTAIDTPSVETFTQTLNGSEGQTNSLTLCSNRV